MPLLDKLDTKIGGAVAKTGNTLNLTDNIIDNDTVIGDFLDMSEGPDFLKSALSGIKDFLHKIGEAYGFLRNIIGKVIDYVNKILSYLDLNKLFDALGLKALMNIILAVIGETLFYGILGDREDFFSLLKRGCVNLQDDLGKSFLLSFILAGVIMGLGCGGEPHAFTLLDLTLKDKKAKEYEEAKNEIKLSISNVPYLDSTTVVKDGVTSTVEYDAAQVANSVAIRDDLTERLEALTKKYDEDMNDADAIMHSTMFIAFNNSKPEAVENLLEDMSTIPAFGKAKFLSNTEPILGFIDKMDVSTLNSLTYEKLVSILSKFDIKLLEKKSATLAYLARESLRKSRMSIAPRDVSQEFKTLVYPTIGEYKTC